MAVISEMKDECDTSEALHYENDNGGHDDSKMSWLMASKLH